MLFPTHLVAAGLLGRVTRLSALWLVVGAAVPDIVDKPLGMLGVTALFHSVGHSALLAIVMVPLALSGRAGVAVTTGWLSHLVLDALHVVVNGRPADVLFLFWPVVTPPEPLAIPPGSFFWYYIGSLAFFLELVIWGVLGVVLVRFAVQGRQTGENEQHSR